MEWNIDPNGCLIQFRNVDIKYDTGKKEIIFLSTTPYFVVPSSGSQKEARGSHGPPEGQIALITKIIDYCLFNPTVEGA